MQNYITYIIGILVVVVLGAVVYSVMSPGNNNVPVTTEDTQVQTDNYSTSTASTSEVSTATSTDTTKPTNSKMKAMYKIKMETSNREENKYL